MCLLNQFNENIVICLKGKACRVAESSICLMKNMLFFHIVLCQTNWVTVFTHCFHTKSECLDKSIKTLTFSNHCSNKGSKSTNTFSALHFVCNSTTRFCKTQHCKDRGDPEPCAMAIVCCLVWCSDGCHVLSLVWFLFVFLMFIIISY